MSGYIKTSFIEKVMDTVHIEEIIGDFVKLKPNGSNFKGLSPFVDEKSPSFMVSPVKRIYKDFSSGKGGNVVNFLMEKKGFSYPEAIEYIAGKYNMLVEYEPQEFSETKKIVLEKKEQLRKVLTLVHEIYKASFKILPEFHPAKKEVKEKRQYDDDTIVEWGIGFAKENFIFDKLESSGYKKEGKDLGLIVYNEVTKNKYDRFSNRVIYPIHDKNGLLIGFGGRALSEGGKTAKWINPTVDQNNLLYEKSKALYGLHKAKQLIKKNNEVFITEGYNDVIAMHRFGCENTVSLSGTAVSEYQVNELRKLCERVVFVMDPDRAGIEAVLKHIPTFLKQGFRTEVISLDLDPDDYVRKYADKITINGGLQKIFIQPGTRKDGFSILINEYIKKDYINIESEIEIEKGYLEDLLSEFSQAKTQKQNEINKLEDLFLTATNDLKQIEIKSGKKEEDYKKQSSVLFDLKTKIAAQKISLKNIKSTELEQKKKQIKNLEDEFLMAFNNSEINRSNGARKICNVIVNITDDGLFEIYLDWIQKESKVSKVNLNKWIKELRAEKPVQENVDYDYNHEYVMPKEVIEPLSTFLTIIKNYGFFMANHKIFMEIPTDERLVHFRAISNFEIKVLQHMNDEKFPRKLIRMKNIDRKEVVFDTPQENVNTPQSFDNMCTAHGNFRFDGDRKDLLKLRRYLLDDMGDGKKVDVLGWQTHERIWVWNNKVIDDEGKDIAIDENGMFIHGKEHFYVPSANRIYKSSNNKYKPQKNFVVIQNKVPIETYMEKVYSVHRDHAISGLLFAISSLFQDLIVDEYEAFPILFLFGPGSSGKDGLIRALQAFMGVPQNAVSLEGDVSTVKGQIRKFAQFRNSMVHLSEFYTGNSKLDGILKGMWDRVGYEKGNIESLVGTDSVDIESSVLLTGNQYPDKEALITRLVWNEMTKVKFTEEEMNEYNKLSDMIKGGASGYSNHLLSYRKLFEQKFSEKFRLWKGILSERFKEPKARIISNLAVLAATFEIIRDSTDVVLPFGQVEMMSHFEKEIGKQLAKMNSASLLIRFWHCFISSLRGNKDNRIQYGHIVNVQGSELFFNWTHVIAKIEQVWFMQYKEAFPGTSFLKDEFTKENLIIRNEKKHAFAKGRNGSQTSAVVINMNLLPRETMTDIVGSIMFQKEEMTIFDKKIIGEWEGEEETEELQNPMAQTAMALPNFKEDGEVLF